MRRRNDSLLGLSLLAILLGSCCACGNDLRASPGRCPERGTAREGPSGVA